MILSLVPHFQTSSESIVEFQIFVLYYNRFCCCDIMPRTCMDPIIVQPVNISLLMGTKGGEQSGRSVENRGHSLWTPPSLDMTWTVGVHSEAPPWAGGCCRSASVLVLGGSVDLLLLLFSLLMVIRQFCVLWLTCMCMCMYMQEDTVVAHKLL